MQAEIKGSTLPVLEVRLGMGEAVITPHGELSWMTPGITVSQTTRAGSGSGLLNTLKRVVGGGSFFLTRYHAKNAPGMVAFAAKIPGHIVPVDIESGRSVLVHRNGWLAGTPGINPTVALQQTFSGGLWGGDGFLLQRLDGRGRAWVELSGEITRYTLGTSQTLLVHPGHIGMFDHSVHYRMTRMRGIANQLFGGDGFMLVSLTGPGEIWLQSMPLPSLAAALAPYLPQDTNDRASERR